MRGRTSKPYIAKGVHTSWTPSPSSRAALGGARSLRASSPFGVYREKYTHEWHARGDATTGDGGEKGELATRPGLERSLINLYSLRSKRFQSSYCVKVSSRPNFLDELARKRLLRRLKFIFPPRKPRDTAKRENCHLKRAAN